MNGYTNLKLPSSIIERIDKLVGKYGFDSRADVTKAALREFFEKYAETKITIKEA